MWIRDDRTFTSLWFVRCRGGKSWFIVTMRQRDRWYNLQSYAKQQNNSRFRLHTKPINSRISNSVLCRVDFLWNFIAPGKMNFNFLNHWIHSPIHDAWSSLMGRLESAFLNCGIATADQPKIKPVFIVPMFTIKAAKTCRNAFPRSFLSGCDSTCTGFVFTICGFVLALLPIKETFWLCLLLIVFFSVGIKKKRREIN